ncbi:putative neural-cadherin 2 [Takifugu flavidus]|uniref:Putative neural-cadherin 2 n=1 Tax=Takifugu flavidus TaxID=433684 RepID=A0A5C6NK71_9TELE|nr:putative neural-cadherin 2 [Takifugu flavidus]
MRTSASVEQTEGEKTAKGKAVCQCPAQFEGPECQQNKHSFHGNGYAWFPPIMPCFESHVSLEFITDVADGLLLYSGPLAQLQTWDHEDFMAIGNNTSCLLLNGKIIHLSSFLLALMLFDTPTLYTLG